MPLPLRLPLPLQRLASAFPGKFRLRTIFIVPFVLQVLAIVSLVGWLAWHAGHGAVDELSLRLRNEISARVQEKLSSALEVPHALNQYNARALELGLLQVADTERLRHYFQQQLMAQNALTLVGYGSEAGSYVDVARLDQPGYLKLAVLTPQQGESKNWKVDLSGKILEAIPSDPKYDHRQRPWYQSAKSRGTQGWSSIYVTKTPQRLVVSATLPLTPHGQPGAAISGVAVSSLSLSGISDFLRQLKVGKTGQSFIIESSGDLVATSTGEVPFLNPGNGGQPKRLAATDSSNALTRATSRFLRQQFADFKQISGEQNTSFELDGARQFVQVLPFRDNKGMSWLIVVVIPEQDFMQEIAANTRTNLYLCIVAVLLAILIGMWTTRWVTGPILAIHQSASEIIQGDWHKTVKLDRTDELGDLALMFNKMTSQLKDTLTLLEARVEERTAQLAEANTLLEQRVQERTQELAQAMSHLAQNEKMAVLGGMVAGITHEINTPLGNVRLAAAGLAAEVTRLAEEMQGGRITRTSMDKFIAYSKATTSLIDRASERSASLIASFKQVAVDQVSERRYRFDLRKIVEHTVQTLGPTLKSTPFIIDIHIPPGIEMDAWPGPIEQIISNLVNNSLLHAFAGREHGAMSVSARQLGMDVEIEYGDDGVGMREDVLNHIFDPFFTTKAGKGGSGLGMYTVYNLVNGLFGGRISIEGRPGLGARFTLYLPNVCVPVASLGE